MNPSAAPAHSGEVEGRYMNGALGESDPEAVEQLIARVLHRAHRTAETFEAPNDARVILHVAHSFADELVMLDPRFDRLQFIKDVIEDPASGPQSG